MMMMIVYYCNGKTYYCNGTGRGRRKCGCASELLETQRHGIVLVCFARLAPAPSPIVLADARPSALPALAFSSIVLTLPRLPRSCSLSASAAPPLVSVWSRPLAATLYTPLIRCCPAACTRVSHPASPTPPASALPASAFSAVASPCRPIISAPLALAAASNRISNCTRRRTVAPCPRTAPPGLCWLLALAASATAGVCSPPPCTPPHHICRKHAAPDRGHRVLPHPMPCQRSHLCSSSSLFCQIDEVVRPARPGARARPHRH